MSWDKFTRSLEILSKGLRDKHSGDIVINITQKENTLWIGPVKHDENYVNMPNMQDNLKPLILEG